MQRKKIIIALAALGCAAVLGVGGYGILSQTTDTFSKSAAADGENQTDDQEKKEEMTDQTDAAADDTALIEGTVTDTAAADTAVATENTSSSTSNKNSGNKGNSGSSSKPSSGNSNKNNGSSNKPSSGSSSKPSSGSSSKPSQPVHTHSYSSAVTKQPTCSSAGTRTYTCSCGKSYTESIPATGNHTWKDQYELQKIPAQTHEEPIGIEICNGCGEEFTSIKDAAQHVAAVFGDSCSSYTSTVRYETVTDVPAKEENVYIGTKCTTCGAWK